MAALYTEDTALIAAHLRYRRCGAASRVNLGTSTGRLGISDE
jgi:hypothetical protein